MFFANLFACSVPACLTGSIKNLSATGSRRAHIDGLTIITFAVVAVGFSGAEHIGSAFEINSRRCVREKLPPKIKRGRGSARFRSKAADFLGQIRQHASFSSLQTPINTAFQHGNLHAVVTIGTMGPDAYSRQLPAKVRTGLASLVGGRKTLTEFWTFNAQRSALNAQLSTDKG